MTHKLGGAPGAIPEPGSAASPRGEPPTPPKPPAFECTRCGACCVAPDIAALDKALGVPCPNLGPDNLCRIYDHRPGICRAYEADALCDAIAAPALADRVHLYLAHFGLEREALAVATSGCRTMTAARQLRTLP